MRTQAHPPLTARRIREGWSARGDRALVQCRSLQNPARTASGSGRNLLVGKPGDVGTYGRVFHCDCANVSLRVNVQHCVFIEIACFCDGSIAKLNERRVSFRKVSNSHGSNRRSRTALWTVSPSGSSITRRKRFRLPGTRTHRRMRPSAWTCSRSGMEMARLIHSSRIAARSGRNRIAAKWAVTFAIPMQH